MNSFKRVRAFKIENLEVLVFEEKGKPATQRKNSRSKLREGPTTNSTHMWFRHGDLNPDPIGGGECSYHCATQLALAEWGDLDF